MILSCEVFSQNGFKVKSGVEVTEKYKQIKKYLTVKKLSVVLLVVEYIGQEFKHFVLPLRSGSAVIPLLWSKFKHLLFALLSL